MNKFSKVLAKVDLFHKKASKLSLASSGLSEAFKSFCKKTLHVFKNDPHKEKEASKIMYDLDTGMDEGKVTSRVNSFVDSLIRDSNVQYVDEVKGLPEYSTLIGYLQTPTSGVSSVNYLSALKTGLAQVKKFLDANVGTDQTPKSTGPERSKNLAAAAAMITGMAKVVNKAAETYSGEFLGAGKYSQLLSLLENFAQSMQIQLGSEYKSSLKGAVDNLVGSAKLKLDMFRGPKTKPLDTSIMENDRFVPSAHGDSKV